MVTRASYCRNVTLDGGNLHLITTKDEITISLSGTIFAPQPMPMVIILISCPQMWPLSGAVPSLYPTLFVISCPLPLHFLPRAFPTNSQYKKAKYKMQYYKKEPSIYLSLHASSSSTIPAKRLLNQEFWIVLLNYQRVRIVICSISAYSKLYSLNKWYM